ncbi:hypothetical protein C4D60_Mb05t17300 [Musa balbisiana]|uniref:Uncharacterized protein n=1 Tax=Musa balbisiana TaxID=52838 RepID=A0A4S8JWS8_MUSBA|nr:hypothetical protein C4D60_Mb05t17300 [Musa balbisiana]
MATMVLGWEGRFDGEAPCLYLSSCSSTIFFPTKCSFDEVTSKQPPALISSEPQPWTSLFKAPIGSPDLSLEFFAPEVQVEKKIAVYEIADSAELIETWSMVIVGYVIGLKTSYFPLFNLQEETPIEFQGGRSPKEINPKLRICKVYTVLRELERRNQRITKL